QPIDLHTAETTPSVRTVFEENLLGCRSSTSSAVLVFSVMSAPNFFCASGLSGVDEARCTPFGWAVGAAAGGGAAAAPSAGSGAFPHAETRAAETRSADSTAILCMTTASMHQDEAAC